MSERLIIVGIAGVARSGKDTVAGILCQRFGFTRIALADGVRSAFRDLDGPTWERTKELEAAGKTSRWALQTLGTEARWRAKAANLWMNLVATKIAYLAELHPAPCHRFVIPDMRFQAEPDFFRFVFGGAFHLWKTTRESAGLTGALASHASEREVASIKADRIVCNDSTVGALESLVVDAALPLIGD